MDNVPAGVTMALAEIRELILRRTSTAYPLMDTNDVLQNSYRLAELVRWLDQRIVDRGRLPEQWEGSVSAHG